MPQRLLIWVKFDRAKPERWNCEHFEEFWNGIREFMLRNPQARLEWIVVDSY